MTSGNFLLHSWREREGERGGGEAIKRELALAVNTAEETEDTRGLDASGE